MNPAPPVTTHRKGVDYRLDPVRGRRDSPLLAGPRAAAGHGCFAPSFQLHLLPTGGVRACCWSTTTIGDVRSQRLGDIWDGARRAALEANLAAGDFSMGCAGCAAQIDVEGRPGSPPAYFDDWSQRVADHPQVGSWPLRIEFEISIACNLQCVQCSGDNSSAIRIHREKRPPLPKAYDDTFFEDLRGFLPHLVEASFVGGEPFLAPENFRIWDQMKELAPTVPTLICTNGTQWNDRVEAVLADLPVQITVSIDGASAATFEAARPGASFEQVMANLDRFRDHAQERGYRVQVNHCLLPHNAHELPEMLLLAEERGMVLNTILVRNPKPQSLVHLPTDRLRSLLRTWELRDDALQRQLHLNLQAWDTELGRLRQWLADDDEPTSTFADRLTTRILMFDRDRPGSPSRAPGDVLAELERHSPSPVLRLAVGSDDLITSLPDEFAATIGVAPGSLLGRPAAGLLEHIDRWEVVDEGDDLVKARMTFAGRAADAWFVPVRDATGRADEAWILVSFGQSRVSSPRASGTAAAARR